MRTSVVVEVLKTSFEGVSKRVSFLDADMMPINGLEYIFELSKPSKKVELL